MTKPTIDEIMQAVYGAGRNSRLKLSDHETIDTWMSPEQAKQALYTLISEEIIGEKEYYHSHYPFVRTEKQWLEGKERIARDELRIEQRDALSRVVGEI